MVLMLLWLQNKIVCSLTRKVWENGEWLQTLVFELNPKGTVIFRREKNGLKNTLAGEC